MKLQKVFASLLLGVSLVGFTTVASAGVMDEIKTKWPNVIVNNKKVTASSGEQIDILNMPIYASAFSREFNAIVGVVLVNMKGKNVVKFEFMRRGDNCTYMDTVQFRDGQGVFQLKASGEPKRTMRNGKVDEFFMIIPEPRDLDIIKNAKSIKVYGHGGSTVLDITRNTYPLNITFNQAVEYAIRHLNENNQ